MKLLYVHNGDFSKPGANKIQVRNMCNAFSKYADVSLISFGENTEKFYSFNKKIKTWFLESKRGYKYRTWLLFKKFLKLKEKFNIIFTRDLFFTYLVKTFLKENKVIYELHEIHKGILARILFKRTFNKLNKIIVISNGLKNELIKKGFDKNKIVVLHDGVNLDKFDLDISKTEARKKIDLSLNKKIVLYIGSFQEWKGYKTLLESSKLTENKDLKFLLVGGEKEEIETLKNKYPKVLIKEFVINEKIPLFLKAADILVIPNSSKYEISVKYTSPLKLFEYMASKRPIIASNLPSIRDIVSEKEVLFFEPENAQDLINKIKKLLKNTKLQEEISKNAFEKVKDYTWEKRAKKILEFYQSKILNQNLK